MHLNDLTRPRQRSPSPTPPQDQDSESNSDDEAYNPDQSTRERRRLRAELRNLEKDLIENRTEFLLPNNDGLKQTLLSADSITGRVKQTGDATIDSRLLVSAADLSLKKVEKLTLGDSQLGVDVDHFIAKCMSFMRSGAGGGGSQRPNATQRNGRRGTQWENDDDEGDMLDWARLGTEACIPYCDRPPTIGFLLGPLSAAPRVKRTITRRAGNSNKDLVETRPEVLKAGDIKKDENANLTVLCHKINMRMREVREKIMDKAEAESEKLGDNATDMDMKKILVRNGIDEEGNLDLFRFVVNPKSFGQTVENLFYVSFLIRDGTVGITVSDDGIPYLIPQDKSPSSGTAPHKRQDGVMKHQAVLSLDYQTWEELIEVFEITEPMIEHRKDTAVRELGGKGWYT